MLKLHNVLANRALILTLTPSSSLTCHAILDILSVHIARKLACQTIELEDVELVLIDLVRVVGSVFDEEFEIDAAVALLLGETNFVVEGGDDEGVVWGYGVDGRGDGDEAFDVAIRVRGVEFGGKDKALDVVNEAGWVIRDWLESQEEIGDKHDDEAFDAAMRSKSRVRWRGKSAWCRGWGGLGDPRLTWVKRSLDVSMMSLRRVALGVAMCLYFWAGET